MTALPLVIMSETPRISAIVPVHNSSEHLRQCLDALLSSSYQALEIIVVDDGSTDNSAAIGRRKGVTVFRLRKRLGPAAARNLGARYAKGEILLFVDSDVVVKPHTVERLMENFSSSPRTAAVFGSYDDEPRARNFLSQYKNLLHHFVHQRSSTEAGTFWAGCGAIRREVFHAVHGFDQERYLKPSIEDIELGCRLNEKGYRIVLDKMLQVQHLKRWSLISLMRTDIFCRALPWSRLMLERNEVAKDLNLQTSDRISAGLVGLWIAMAPFSLLEPQLLYVLAILLFILITLNWRLYRFFVQKRGITFAAFAFSLHSLYYFYSGASFVTCWIVNILERNR